MAKQYKRKNIMVMSILAGIISFVVIFIILVYTSGFDLTEAWEIITDAKWWLIIVAGLTNVLSFILETFQHWFLARAMGKFTSFWRMMRIYFLGLFFEYTTPSTSGGQPMQVWFLTDEGYSVAEGTVLVTVKGLISVLVRIIYVIIIFAMIPFGFNLNLETAQYVVFLVTVFGFLLLVVGGFIIINNPTWFSFLFKFLARFRLLRKWTNSKTPTEFYKKGKQVLNEVRYSAKKMLSGNKWAVAFAVINSIITWTILKLMPYFVLVALGIFPNVLAVIAMGVIAQLSTAWYQHLVLSAELRLELQFSSAESRVLMEQ
ncbi:MAG: lysylphosphatidylglycerol synthase transmembrane domain-containing protein [Caldisericia bacterium]